MHIYIKIIFLTINNINKKFYYITNVVPNLSKEKGLTCGKICRYISNKNLWIDFYQVFTIRLSPVDSFLIN